MPNMVVRSRPCVLLRPVYAFGSQPGDHVSLGAGRDSQVAALDPSVDTSPRRRYL